MEQNMKTILAFINHFKFVDAKVLEETFTQGCCYWFAEILAVRFKGIICYNQIDNHFATKIGGELYDITGVLDAPYSDVFVPWIAYQAVEPLDAGRVQRDCIDFI